MPIRFPTEAANADVLGEDADTIKTQPERPPRSFSNDGTRRPRAEGESKPGKDINQPGFIKDKE